MNDKITMEIEIKTSNRGKYTCIADAQREMNSNPNATGAIHSLSLYCSKKCDFFKTEKEEHGYGYGWDTFYHYSCSLFKGKEGKLNQNFDPPMRCKSCIEKFGPSVEEIEKARQAVIKKSCKICKGTGLLPEKDKNGHHDWCRHGK